MEINNKKLPVSLFFLEYSCASCSHKAISEAPLQKRDGRVIGSPLERSHVGCGLWVAQWRYSKFPLLWRDCWATRYMCFYETAHTRRQLECFHGNIAPHWLGLGETMASKRVASAGEMQSLIMIACRRYVILYLCNQSVECFDRHSHMVKELRFMFSWFWTQGGEHTTGIRYVYRVK